MVSAGFLLPDGCRLLATAPFRCCAVLLEGHSRRPSRPMDRILLELYGNYILTSGNILGIVWSFDLYKLKGIYSMRLNPF